MSNETPAPVFGIDKLEELHESVLDKLNRLKESLEEHEREKLQGCVAFVGALVDVAKRLEQGEVISAILIVDSGDCLSTRAHPPTPLITLVGMLELAKDSLLQERRETHFVKDVAPEPENATQT
jgi:hypothetical protein